MKRGFLLLILLLVGGIASSSLTAKKEEKPPVPETHEFIFHGDGTFASKLQEHYAVVDIIYDGKDVVRQWRVDHRTAFDEVLLRGVKKQAELKVYVTIYNPEGEEVEKKDWRHRKAKDGWFNFRLDGKDWRFYMGMKFNNAKQDVLVYMG